MSPFFKSSTGLPENIAASLCYLFAFIGGIVFLALEKRSRFVMFHALQSVLAFGAVMIAHALCGFIPLIGPLIAGLLSILTLVMWIVLLFASLQGKWLKLPWIGDLAEKQLHRL
ncbi:MULTISPECIES: DUF4870 domain-containing protein [Paenibacillus]|uniref:Membrane protein n=1 Tax=Paenibacillus albilobatus TaxID=2716884 RepID=A0A919XKA9_9BACL|nr:MULTISPECIES: hypothetical protein [Paenibacillus]MDR9852448.1 hypothetical protein [Paenibacillus sp. VCA1]GIO32287.1 membrane protein [Paenibacillus albilobatus]